MNVTAPEVIRGRPLGETALDILDTLVAKGASHLRDIAVDTGRRNREIVLALWNLQRSGKVERLGGRGGRWNATLEGRMAVDIANGVRGKDAPMLTWTCKGFVGHYPVGTAAVIMAPTEEDARIALDEALRAAGLPGIDEKDEVLEVQPHTSPMVIILCDGDY